MSVSVDPVPYWPHQHAMPAKIKPQVLATVTVTENSNPSNNSIYIKF